MASDIAEILKQNFLEFVQDKDLNLSPTITSLFEEIEKEFTENKGYWSPPPVESLSYFYQLDHTLSEYRANKKTFTLFSRLDPVERAHEKTLHDIKENLHQMRKSVVNTASNSTLFTSCMYPTRKDAPNFSIFNEEVQKIVNWLESNDRFKAIAIHGMCGTGKTTLARMVLDDQRVRDKYEEPMWVCLYDLKASDEMDVRIVKEMLSHFGEDPDLLTEEPEDNWLVERLNQKLKGRKYLIVLDAVWHCNDWFGDLYDDGKGDDMSKVVFSQALPKDSGGAVIVTSRHKEVSRILVREKNLIHLRPWDDEKLKELVKECLVKQGKSLEKINEENIDCVVYHCHGLPLVAVTLSDWIVEQIIAKKSSSD
ncbi:putative disease resistance protein, partial [Mucuna pruriens]